MFKAVGKAVSVIYFITLSPGSNDLHLRSEALDAQLEPDLVVTLAGAAVTDGVGALFLGDLNQPLGNDGPGKGGTPQLSLIPI